MSKAAKASEAQRASFTRASCPALQKNGLTKPSEFDRHLFTPFPQELINPKRWSTPFPLKLVMLPALPGHIAWQGTRACRQWQWRERWHCPSSSWWPVVRWASFSGAFGHSGLWHGGFHFKEATLKERTNRSAGLVSKGNPQTGQTVSRGSC